MIRRILRSLIIQQKRKNLKTAKSLGICLVALQIKDLWLRQVKGLIQGHRARDSQDLTPNLVNLQINPCCLL